MLHQYENLVTMTEYAVLGQYCSLATAKCLKQVNVSYEILQTAFEEHYNNHMAFTHLCDKGITRKSWEEREYRSIFNKGD